MYALLNKKEAKTSEEARNEVKSQLEDDDSFVGEGGRFGSPIADWFVIGGRWSGDLSSHKLDKDFHKEVRKAIKPENKFGYTDEEIVKNMTKFQEIWESLGGKGKNAYNRDQYEDGGMEDDGQIVDEKLWDNVIKPLFDDTKYESKWGIIKRKNDYNSPEPILVDLDQEEEINFSDKEKVKKDIVGKKWIVVVDYHN